MKILSPPDKKHYFFGYYDLQPYSQDGKRHLAHRVEFADRRPASDDICEVGYIELNGNAFVPVAQTRAWNFQQGALLNWFGEDKIIYNDRRQTGLCGVIKDINSGKEQIINKPLACLSNDRGKGLSVNFARIFDFRAGYGYAGVTDSNHHINAPEDDGVFLVDLASGAHRLIVSYKDIKEQFYRPPYSDGKLVINHITFNPSGDRFLFLVRNFPAAGGKRGTQLITSDLNGNMYELSPFRVVSHYDWYDDRTIMAIADFDGVWDIHFLQDLSLDRSKLSNGFFKGMDIHCLYSPDKTRFCGDGYPDKSGKRKVYLCDLKTEQVSTVADLYSVNYSDTDIRCDLHARWRPDGKALSLDTTHNLTRQIVEIEV